MKVRILAYICIFSLYVSIGIVFIITLKLTKIRRKMFFYIVNLGGFI